MRLPSRQFGDPLLADRTFPLLLSPQKQQHFEPSERPLCLNIEALLKILFPMRVVGIGFTFDFGVPANGSVGEAVEPELLSGRSFLPAEDRPGGERSAIIWSAFGRAVRIRQGLIR
jgi:hypothetical protein